MKAPWWQWLLIVVCGTAIGAMIAAGVLAAIAYRMGAL